MPQLIGGGLSWFDDLDTPGKWRAYHPIKGRIVAWVGVVKVV